MPQLNGIASGIERLLAEKGEQRVNSLFGIDPAAMPEKPDPVAERKEHHNEALCKALASLENAVKSASDSQVKVIDSTAVKIPDGLASDKGIDKSIKALGKVIETSLKTKPNDGIQELMERMVEILNDNHRLSTALIAALEKEDPPQPDTVFTIVRDRNDFISTVTARAEQ